MRRQRLTKRQIRFRGLDDSGGARRAAELSGTAPGAEIAESESPKLTSCAELEEGVIGAEWAADAVPDRSDCHI